MGSIADADPEVKVDFNVHATVAAVPFCPVVEYFRRTSSWHRLKKSVAWFLQYRDNLRLASTQNFSGKLNGALKLCCLMVAAIHVELQSY